MNRIITILILALCMGTLHAQELLDFSQPDPISATPTRSSTMFRFTENVRMDFSPVLVDPEGGFEISPSLMLGFQVRPWRNRHYFNLGVALEYVNSSLWKTRYVFSGDILSLVKAENGALGMDRFGYAFPLTYGFDINPRQSLEFSVIPHYWTSMKMTNLYGSGPQYDYAQAQGLNQNDGIVAMGTYYKGFSPFTVDFSVVYYPITHVGIGLRFAPPMLFKRDLGPSYTTFSWSFLFRL